MCIIDEIISINYFVMQLYLAYITYITYRFAKLNYSALYLKFSNYIKIITTIKYENLEL